MLREQKLFLGDFPESFKVGSKRVCGFGILQQETDKKIWLLFTIISKTTTPRGDNNKKQTLIN